MTTTASSVLSGPASYFYRGYKIVIEYDPRAANKYGAEVVSAHGEREPIGPHFLETGARMAAEHCVNQKLAHRVVSQAEIELGEDIDAMCETDR